MHAGKISNPVFLSFLIIMFMTVIGCGKMQATSVISGTVNGENIDGLTINMTGAATTSETTDASGKYSFNSMDNGLYIITPYRDGFSFEPANAEVYISGASATNVDFTSSWTGYPISGAVTGDILEGVKLTAYVFNTTTEVVSVTTNSDGQYSLANSSFISSSFDVKPSLLGYKFTPFAQTVTITNASKKILDFVSKAAHINGSAKGTYTWNSTTGDLTVTWTSVTAPCNWPKSGTKTESKVTISAKIMTWQDEIKWPGVMIWKRTKSTIGDPEGEWTSTDQSGNTYTATFTVTNSTTDPDTDLIITASGSISLDESIVACSYAWASSDEKVSLSYQDPGKAAANVIVTGSGISTSLELEYNGSGEWNTGASGNVDVSASTIVPPYTYTFTVKDSGTTWQEQSCSVDWPTNLKPTGTITTTLPTFSWDGAGSSGATYIVQLRDKNYNWIWESVEDSKTSATFESGPHLKEEESPYHYYVIVTGASGCSYGKSFVEGSFLYDDPLIP
jgi:hypothetical protein